MKSAMEKSPNKCPSLHEIEYFALDNFQKNGCNISIKSHIKNCVNCQQRYFEVIQFYQELDKQLHRPISNPVIEFVHQLEQRQINISIFVLKVISPSETNDRVFKARLHQSVTDNSPLMLPDVQGDSVLLRIFQNSPNSGGCISVSGNDSGFYQNIELQFPNLGISYYTNSYGYGNFKPFQINKLDNELVKIIPQ